jgi:hypothetical protein
MKIWKLVLFAVAILSSLSGVGLAVPTVYTDFAAFAANHNPVLVEDFEAVVPKDTAVPSFTSNSITYTGMQASSPNVWVTGPAYVYNNFGAPLASLSVLTGNGPEDFMIDLSAVANMAVGFDVYLNDLGPVVTSYYGAADNLLLTHVDSRGAGAVRFLGVSADEPIYKIRWTSTGGQTINTGLDNLRLGTAMIPAPGAILLTALGASLVGWLRGRRTF